MAEHWNRRTCDTRDSKVTTADLIAYIYAKEKNSYFIYAPVGFCSFLVEMNPAAAFRLSLILTD